MIYDNAYLIEFEDTTQILVDPLNYVDPQDYILHIVKDDETLFDISQQHYNSTDQWVRIAEVNFEVFTTPLVIPAGTTLKIPIHV